MIFYHSFSLNSRPCSPPQILVKKLFPGGKSKATQQAADFGNMFLTFFAYFVDLRSAARSCALARELAWTEKVSRDNFSAHLRGLGPPRLRRGARASCQFVRRSGGCGETSPSCPHAPLRGPRELRTPASFFRPRRAPPLPLVGDSVLGKSQKGSFCPGRFRRNLGTFSRSNIFLEKMFFCAPRC